MKSQVVIDKSGNWKLMSKKDGEIFANGGYEVHNLFHWLWQFSRTAIKFAILIWLISSANKFTNHDLTLAFLFLLLMEVYRVFKWW